MSGNVEGLSSLRVVSSNVELNSGPGSSQRQNNSQNPQTFQVSTRQQTLSFAQVTNSASPDRHLYDFGHIGSNEIMSFLNTMKTDITQQNSQVRMDLNGLSSKMDTINQSINELKAENVSLKNDNKQANSENYESPAFSV